MKKTLQIAQVTLMLLASMVLMTGCNPDEATDAVNNAGAEAKKVAEGAGDAAKDMAAKGGEMANKLGEQAMGFLKPLKEKIGNLEGMSDAPEKLKESVNGLITMIEEKAESLELPDMIKNGISKLKEQLVALKDYLAGEAEESKISEHIQKIMSTAKESLKM